MTIEHTSALFDECLALYYELGFTELDMESVGGPTGMFLLSPDSKDMVNLIPSKDNNTVDRHYLSAVFGCPDKNLPNKLKEKGYKFKKDNPLMFGVRMPDGVLVKMELSLM